MHVVECSSGVRVGSDFYSYAQLLRLPAVAPVQVQAVRISVELHGYADGCRLLEDCLDVERVGLSREKQSARWVSENSQMRIIHGGENAFGHGVAFHAEPGMDGADDVIELIEDGSIVVEAAVRENIGFDPLQNANAFDPGVQFIDLFVLP